MLPNDPKGNPVVVSNNPEGEEITPDNPEIVKQFPVDLTDKEQVAEAEGQSEEKGEQDK